MTTNTSTRPWGRTIVAGLVAGSVLFVAFATASSAADDDVKAQKATPVAEVNVDGDGFIKVRQQGVVEVDVVSGEVGVTVDDSTPLDVSVTGEPTVELGDQAEASLKAIEEAIVALGTSGGSGALPVVEHSVILRYEDDGVGRFDFDPMLMTHLTITANGDHGYFQLGDTYRALEFEHDDIDLINVPYSHPIRVRYVNVWCLNAVIDCEFVINVHGLSYDGDS